MIAQLLKNLCKAVGLMLAFGAFSLVDASESLHRDQAGFIDCIQVAESSINQQTKEAYFLSWDHLTQFKIRSVSVFSLSDYIKATGHRIRGCQDVRFLQEIPANILKSPDNVPYKFSEDVLFSIQQISEGAHSYRFEKTAEEYIKNRSSQFRADQPEVLSNLRYDVGDRFAQEVIFVFSQKLFTKLSRCEDYIGTCDFYLCQEQKNPCGLDSYNLSFGYKYCSGSKFKLLGQMRTDLGRQWVTSVFQCLQKASALATSKANGQQSCESIQATSYQSHPHCYVESGFCELKLGEKIKIFNLVKTDIFSSLGLAQVQEVLQQCRSQVREHN